jgi:hypothetical protein
MEYGNGPSERESDDIRTLWWGPLLWLTLHNDRGSALTARTGLWVLLGDYSTTARRHLYT